MSKINFKEIIECSSQKSALTGQAGFGIRTYTEGLEREFVEKVAKHVALAYDVDIDRMVSKKAILADSNVTTQYPRTLKFTAYTDQSGKTTYCIACATYVGIDYGYFINIESAQRAGSNYVTDTLLFDEKPSASLFYELLKQKAFRPIDNTCTPDNAELVALLTGEPALLAPRSIELPDEPADLCDKTVNVALALLQTKINRDLGKPEALQGIVFQAAEAAVPMTAEGPAPSATIDLFKAFAALPGELLEGLFFQTNYLQGYGMPKGLRMITLNQYNTQEVSKKNYVYLNLDDGSMLNIDTDNAFFQKLREVAAAGDKVLFFNLVRYLYGLKVDTQTDYAFLYNLYCATDAEKVLDVNVLTADFFDKVTRAQLSGDKLAMLQKNVSLTLAALVQSDLGKALDLIALLQSGRETYLKAFDEDKKKEGTNGEANLEQMATLALFPGNGPLLLENHDLQAIRYLNDSGIAADGFFETMKRVGKHNVWLTLVKDWEAQNPEQIQANHINLPETVIDTILDSKAVSDKEGLIKEFYPLEDNSHLSMYYDYLKSHPASIASLPSVVEKLYSKSSNKNLFFEELLAASANSPVVVRALQPHAQAFLANTLQSGQSGSTGNPFDFLQKLKDNGISGFDFSATISDYERTCLQHPLSANMTWADWFLNDTVFARGQKDVFRTIRALNAIPNSREPLGENALASVPATLQDLELALRMKKEGNVRLALLKKWIGRATESQLQTYLTALTKSVTVRHEELELMLETIWNGQQGTTRERMIDQTLKAIRWEKPDRTAYLKNSRETALVAYIVKPRTAMQKVAFFFKSLTNKKPKK